MPIRKLKEGYDYEADTARATEMLDITKVDKINNTGESNKHQLFLKILCEFNLEQIKQLKELNKTQREILAAITARKK